MARGVENVRINTQNFVLGKNIQDCLIALRAGVLVGESRHQSVSPCLFQGSIVSSLHIVRISVALLA